MLEQIFGSKTRVQIITLFVRNADRNFYVREMSRITGQYINSIRRELQNLERFGLLKSMVKFKRKYYTIDKNFLLFDELKNLFLKSKVFLENELTTALRDVGQIKLLVFSGQFTGAPTPVDLLIVGDKIKTDRLRGILENYSFGSSQPIKYTVFETGDYTYRQEISDYFLDQIFSNKHIILIDKLS